MTNWYYSDSGAPSGPHATEDIRSLLLVGQLDKTALVWCEGMAQWSPIRSRAEFADLFPAVTPPPLPPRSIQPIPTAPAIQPAPQIDARLDSAPLIEMERPTEPDDSFAVEPASGELTYPGTVGLAGPWTRYFARTFDLSLIGTVIATAITLALPYISVQLSLQWYMIDSRAVFLVMLPFLMLINAAILATFGNTLGKVIFGIKAIPIAGDRKFTLRDHAGRELTVWGKGMFFGIPVLNFFTMVPAYRKVRDKLPTDYDLGRATVRSFSTSTFRRIIGMLLTALLLAGIYALNAVERVDQQRLQTSSRWTNPVTGLTATIPAGWQHEVVEGPEGNRLDGFTNINTGVVALIGVETGDFTLEAYKVGLATALASSTPLGPWTPAELAIPMSKASGQSIEDRWPTTIYVTQTSTSFWRIVYIDMAKSTPREISEPELTTALFGTVR